MEACESSFKNGTTERYKQNDFLQKMFRKKMFNLRWELSGPEKCCCLPLKFGFLVLAYFKLVLFIHMIILLYKETLDMQLGQVICYVEGRVSPFYGQAEIPILVLSVTLFLGILHLLLLMYKIFSREEMLNHCVAWTAISIDVVDIVIGVIIIVSAYKKNVILMEMYYKCSIYVIGLLSIMCCFVFHLMYGNIYDLLIIIILFILITLMQVYLNQMVKSEVLKLKSTSQFQILKNDTDSFCTYINNDDN